MDLYYADPAQHLKTTGEDLDDVRRSCTTRTAARPLYCIITRNSSTPHALGRISERNFSTPERAKTPSDASVSMEVYRRGGSKAVIFFVILEKVVSKLHPAREGCSLCVTRYN